MALHPSYPATPPGAISVLSRLTAAVPDFFLAGAFLITWIEPETFGKRVVAYLMLVMLLEFIIVHSSALLGSLLVADSLSKRTKVYSLLGLGVVYALFAAGFSAGFNAWWPLWTILGLTANRLLILLLDMLPTEQEQGLTMAGWAMSVVLYVGFVMVTLLLPMPHLGITPEVIAAQDLPSSGIWVDEPYRVIAFGFFYFAGMGVFELFSYRWLRETPSPTPAVS